MADLNETHLGFYGDQGNKFCLHVKDIGLGMSSKLFVFFSEFNIFPHDQWKCSTISHDRFIEILTVNNCPEGDCYPIRYSLLLPHNNPANQKTNTC